MAKYYESMKAVCPYYKHENRFVIFCQGIDEESVLHLAFPKPSSCLEFKNKYCRKNYAQCSIHNMLINKYNNII